MLCVISWRRRHGFLVELFMGALRIKLKFWFNLCTTNSIFCHGLKTSGLIRAPWNSAWWSWKKSFEMKIVWLNSRKSLQRTETSESLQYIDIPHNEFDKITTMWNESGKNEIQKITALQWKLENQCSTKWNFPLWKWENQHTQIDENKQIITLFSEFCAVKSSISHRYCCEIYCVKYIKSPAAVETRKSAHTKWNFPLWNWEN